MKQTFAPLYGISSKGVTKFWEIRVEHCREGAVIITKHGQLGGKIQEARVTIREGKNLGKANATTPLEQACLEAESKWKKQHDKNYTEHEPKADLSEPLHVQPKLLPMLAQKFHERKKYIQWPAFIQPKLNGVRCLVERKGNKIFYWSRKAKQYKNFNLYMDQEFLSRMLDGEILDGEMYNHGDITFQELISLIKDEKTPDLVSLKKYVKFWCYDRPDGERGFRDRFVEHILGIDGLQYVRCVQTLTVKNEEEVKLQHAYYVQDGYEGSIIRSGGNEPYNFQYRDNQLQKYKDFQDAEFIIVGCKEGVGKDEGKAIFRCTTSPEGKEFDVRCKGTDALRRSQWQQRTSYIGKPLTVRYQTLSDDGIPIFPVGITVRDYE